MLSYEVFLVLGRKIQKAIFSACLNNVVQNHKDPIIQHSAMHPRVSVPSQMPPTSPQMIPSNQQIRPAVSQSKIPSNSQSAFVIPWHSIVPILTACPEPVSPPLSELSPPLSAPPVTTVTTTMANKTEPGVEEDSDVVELPIAAEEDDDVFETETADPNVLNDNSSNKRRSQSLSSLQSNVKDNALVKV